MANFVNKAKSKFLDTKNTLALKWVKNKPELLIGAGVALTAVSVFIFCKKTLNTPEIIEDHKEAMANVNEAVKEKAIGPEEAKKEKAHITKETAVRVASNYLLPFLLYGLGTTAIIVGAVEGRTDRNELAAAVTAQGALIAGLRSRMEERFGKEVADDIYYDRNTVKYTEMHNDGTTEERTVKTHPLGSGSPMEFIFSDQTSSKYEHGDLGMRYNIMLIKSVCKEFDDELNSPWGGRVIRVNEARKALGLEELGMYDGWGWLPKDRGGSVDHVSFGYEKYMVGGAQGVDLFPDTPIHLEFNAEFIADKY